MGSPRQSLKPTLVAGLYFALSFTIQNAVATEAPVSHVHRTLACGPVTVISDTLLSSPNNDADTQGLSQSITLTDVSRKLSFALPLFQHWSKNNRLKKKVLDGLVWAFQCARSRSGEIYIILLWSGGFN